MGKMMEKAGGLLHKPKLEEQGARKREQASGTSDEYNTGSSDTGYNAGNNDYSGGNQSSNFDSSNQNY